jgi:hypothetical protein
MVHTSGRGSVQAVVASGWLAQADSMIKTAMAQTRRMGFSRIVAHEAAGESVTPCYAPRTLNVLAPR